MGLLDIFFVLKADIYYSTTTQNALGAVERSYVFDRTVPCSIAFTTNYKDQNVYPEQATRVMQLIDMQVREDIRYDSNGQVYSLSNIFITNIRGTANEVVDELDADPTVYEVIGHSPHFDPVGRKDYIRLTLNRTEIVELP